MTFQAFKKYIWTTTRAMNFCEVGSSWCLYIYVAILVLMLLMLLMLVMLLWVLLSVLKMQLLLSISILSNQCYLPFRVSGGAAGSQVGGAKLDPFGW